MVNNDRKTDQARDDKRGGARKDVREAVEAQDRERERRMEEWRKQYEAWLEGDGAPPGEQGEHHEQDRDTPVSPLLMIRYADHDNGARPLPAGTHFWNSPNIQVESSDPSGNPVAGEPNTVKVLITNHGAFQAAPVQVDFYWANPSLGLGPANMNHIGTEWADIPAGPTTKPVTCPTPWIPVMVNNGHECVMVNCSCWLSDPIIHPFQPTLDRHVGQRNLHVVPGKAGMVLTYTFQVNNVFPFEMPAVITAEFDRLTMTEEAFRVPQQQLGALAATFSQRGATSSFDLTDRYVRDSPAHRMAQRGARLERRGSLATPTYFRRAEGVGMSVKVSLTGAHGIAESENSGTYAASLIQALDTFRKGKSGEPTGTVIERFILDPLAFRTIEAQVDVPTNATRGDIFITHLSHHAGPLTAGGYSIAVVIE